MEYLSLVFLHVFFGILWAGAAVAIGVFVLPAVLEAGPAGGAVMAGVAKRKFPIFMTVIGAIVLLTGARLYMIRFTPGWITTPEGIVITLGALLAIAAFIIGISVQRPTVERIGAIAAQIAASGAPPTPAQASELQASRQKLRKAGSITAWHVLAAAALMAMHRSAMGVGN